MVWALRQFSGLPHNKIVGMAGVLDSARFRHFLAEELNVSVEDVSAFVLGGHGDTMVPMPRFSTVAGIRLAGTGQDGLDQAGPAGPDRAAHPRWRRRDRRPAQDRLGLLRAGHQRPSPWRKAISRTRSASCPAPSYVDGAYGIKDLYVGLPVVIGEKGVERIVELELTAEEKAGLDKSADAVKGLIDACKKLEPKLS